MTGIPELLIIAVIVMVFFGPGKLHEVLGSMGQGVKMFRDAANEERNRRDDDGESDRR